ncbi:MAG: TOBE domain-containing protein [Desulfamplus sp.]|nr:TOBE domain-containing protein [Desulfamplus sp.]
MMTDTQKNNSVSIKTEDIHGRIVSSPDSDKCLDSVQLHQLELSFREWSESSSRSDVRVARRRILLVFLLIRYTGAKLSEVLSLDPFEDIDYQKQCLFFGRTKDESFKPQRKVQISSTLCNEIKKLTNDHDFKDFSRNRLNIDPGFVRRKFYERAEACGIVKQLGAPEILRRSRAIELMQNNMPLPAVQMILGHSTPNLTSSYVSFSEDDLQKITKLFMEKESTRKTSARNSFFGKILTILKGDIQARVELMTMGGDLVTTIITNGSLNRLDLKVGTMITAEVKAPYVILQKADNEIKSSADNIFNGVVKKITIGKINTEYIVQISDGTEVCSLVTSESCRRIDIKVGDDVWILFNGFSVLLSE